MLYTVNHVLHYEMFAVLKNVNFEQYCFLNINFTDLKALLTQTYLVTYIQRLS